MGFTNELGVLYNIRGNLCRLAYIVKDGVYPLSPCSSYIQARWPVSKQHDRLTGSVEGTALPQRSPTQPWYSDGTSSAAETETRLIITKCFRDGPVLHSPATQRATTSSGSGLRGEKSL